jgi:hypothetical protein
VGKGAGHNDDLAYERRSAVPTRRAGLRASCTRTARDAGVLIETSVGRP